MLRNLSYALMLSNTRLLHSSLMEKPNLVFGISLLNMKVFLKIPGHGTAKCSRLGPINCSSGEIRKIKNKRRDGTLLLQLYFSPHSAKKK